MTLAPARGGGIGGHPHRGSHPKGPREGFVRGSRPGTLGPVARRVLVVDDNTAQREIVAEILEGEGYEVAVAQNGIDGLAAARASPPAVVILDLMMPGLDGAAVLRELRADPALAAVRVVVTTGLSTALVTKLLQPDATLFKPFGMRELLAVLDRLAPG